MATLLRIDDPLRRPGAPLPPAFALWALGFRPFYLLASVWAALLVPLWVMQLSGLVTTPLLRGAAWHAHEMVFGFGLAVVVGFLYTAGRSWSGQPTPSGPALMALAAMWLAARLLVLSPWTLAAGLANVAFPLAAAAGLWRALRAGSNRRNDFFVWVLLGFAGAAAGVHLGLAGALPLGRAGATVDPALPGTPASSAASALALAGQHAGLDLLLLLITIMAGRVVPMFTANAIPTAQPRRDAGLERGVIASVLALLVLDLLQAGLGQATATGRLPVLRALLAALGAGVCLLGALLHARRWWLWQPLATRHKPLVWVLHLAYAWLPLHLLLRALAEPVLGGLVAPTLAVHALTVGAVGGLVIGMMTRTARGHTGRVLRADAADVAMYALVNAAALLRVAGPLAWPGQTLPALQASAACWSAAFAVYALHYGPWLCQRRDDGQPG